MCCGRGQLKTLPGDPGLLDRGGGGLVAVVRRRAATWSVYMVSALRALCIERISWYSTGTV